MAHRYINVRLVDFDDPTYREFIAPYLLARATHKGGPVRARVRFGQQVETVLRRWLEARAALSPRRLVGYTELGEDSARPAYRELDALELVGERAAVVYEFKASRSPMSLRRGLAQLNKSQRILSSIFRQVTGVLLFVYTDPETLPDLHHILAETDYAANMPGWEARHELEPPIGVLLWPVARVVEVAGPEDLILELEDEEGEDILIAREEAPWRKDWQAYQEEEGSEEPLGALGAALLAALGETDERGNAESEAS
jgi:hypothetical protein